MKLLNRIVLVVVCLISSCSYYSFTGKAIPPHIKTAQFILFEDNSSRYDLRLPDLIKENLSKKIEDSDILEIENSINTDSEITGIIKNFDDVASAITSDEKVSNRKLTITISISFFDKSKKEFIVRNQDIQKEITYNEKEGEAAYKEAFNSLIEDVCEESLIKISSNW